MNYGMIFAGFNVSEEEKFRVGTEITKVGSLTFDKIEKSAEGWFAQCKEIEGIIAGSTNPTPTNTEIESEIRQAIFSAFNVKIIETPTETPFKFEYGRALKNQD